MDTYYRYDRAKGRCAELKLVWNREIESQVDQVFARLGLSQAQVDELSVLHCHVTKWLFSPRAYDWRGRIALALHFLFGISGGALAGPQPVSYRDHNIEV